MIAEMNCLFLIIYNIFVYLALSLYAYYAYLYDGQKYIIINDVWDGLSSTERWRHEDNDL